MSAQGSRGVSALATLLAHLASGEPIRASDFARRHGYARSSVFELARRLQALGLMTRDDDGQLLAGPAAYEFAWARHGLQGMRGPAEAMVVWLRDHIDADVAIFAGDDALLSLSATTAREASEITLPVRDRDGRECITLKLRLRSEIDPALVRQALGQAVATLEQHLEQRGASPA